MAKTYVLRESWDRRGYDIFEIVGKELVHEGSARVRDLGGRRWGLFVTFDRGKRLSREEYPLRRDEGLARAHEILILDYRKKSNRIIDQTSFNKNHQR